MDYMDVTKADLLFAGSCRAHSDLKRRDRRMVILHDHLYLMLHIGVLDWTHVPIVYLFLRREALLMTG